MENTFDIRIIKKELRFKYRSIRQNMNSCEKQEFDNKIFQKLINFDEYKKADTVLCFVSKPIEVDTKRFIEYSLKIKKTVAVPKCFDLNGKMDFYIIKDLNELEIVNFGILEPNIKKATKLKKYDNSICIVPGLAFDINGYRVGFGKGYYDRFLSKYHGIKIGICYNSCMDTKLPTGKFDVKSDYIVTPKYILTIDKHVI